MHDFMRYQSESIDCGKKLIQKKIKQNFVSLAIINQIQYRNNSATWLYTDKITCNAGALTNGAGATVYNLQRPNCAFKAREFDL